MKLDNFGWGGAIGITFQQSVIYFDLNGLYLIALLRNGFWPPLAVLHRGYQFYDLLVFIYGCACY